MLHLFQSDESLPVSTVIRIYFFVFFFQAEDGIRDKLVTGVQTCALPISRRCSRRQTRGVRQAAEWRDADAGTRAETARRSWWRCRESPRPGSCTERFAPG